MSLDRYLAGDDSALNAAVVECMPIVEETVLDFVNKKGFGHLYDDLVSEGYLKLMTAVPKIRKSLKESAEENPTGYLQNAIRSCILEFISKEVNVGMPRRSRHRALKNGKAVASCSADSDGLEQHRSREDAAELREMIGELCEDADQRMIVDMRARGFTNQEISDELHIDTREIAKLLNQLETKVDKELQEA